MTWTSQNHRFLATMLKAIVARLAAAVEDEEPPPNPWSGEWPDWSDPEREPTIRALCTRLELSTFERDLLLLCVAMELEGPVANLCGKLHGNPDLSYPTVRLALKVLSGGSWRAVSEGSPLRRWGILQLDNAPVRTLARLSCEERVWQHLLDVTELDGRLVNVVTPTPPLVAEDRSRQALVADLGALLTDEGEPPLVVQLTGMTAAAQVALARSAADSVGLKLMRVPVARLPLESKALSSFAGLLAREVQLEPRAVLLDVHPDQPDPVKDAAVRALVHALPGVTVIATPKALHIPGRSAAVIDVPVSTEEDQRATWEALFGEHPVLARGRSAAYAAADLAASFHLEPLDIQTAGRQAMLAVTTGGGIDAPAADPRNACRILARSRMGPLAEHIGKSASWEDLVLPEGQQHLLGEIAQHSRHRATVFSRWGMAGGQAQGLAVLFAGPSGTGKTLAARALASHLGLDLWRIDLSRVIDKYIGETEKNLARVFDAAEGGGAVLLFDEADALFGKRSAVKDSHDRYANIQVGYLLQRMEAYRGTAILTTNMKGSLDPAFVRRLRFIVDFPMPDANARAEIWRRALPDSLPTEGVLPMRLAQLNVTGAVIAGIATHGAVLAAEESARAGREVPLNMAHLKQAAIREFQKHGQPLTRPELRGWEAPGGA